MKSIAFKGTDTIATILSAFGKIKTNGTKVFTLEISDLESTLANVKVGAIPTKEEKELALATLSAAEQATLAKLSARVAEKAKELATARTEGQTSERWTTTGQISIA